MICPRCGLDNVPGNDQCSSCLLDLAPPDIAWFQERSDIVLVPIGSCEQHGAHLPLGTDTITALEVSRRAAAKADVPYTAPLWIGYSPQHMAGPGDGRGARVAGGIGLGRAGRAP